MLVKIRRRIDNIQITEYQLLNLLKIIRRKQNGKWRSSFHLHKTNITSNEVVYLKTNQSDKTSMLCLQNWVNICTKLNRNIVIVCDSYELKAKIQNSIHFGKTDVSYIGSRSSKLTKLAKSLVASFWLGAARAHLATFFHAQAHNISSFWNIDADDTFLVTSVENACSILLAVEQLAQRESIDNFSFDMHHSLFNSKHWSFGITLVRNPEKAICNLNPPNPDWANSFRNICDLMNLDWYFTYLWNNNILNNGTFYVENIYLFHKIPQGRCLCLFQNNHLIHPLYKGTNLYILPIASTSINLNLNIDTSSRNYLFDTEYLLLNGLTDLRNLVKG